MIKPFTLVMLLTLAANAQFVSVSGGGVVTQGHTSSTTLGTARADFDRSAIVAVDAGLPIFPFVTGGVHYSYSRPELSLFRGDAFGSRATVRLQANTLAFEARVHTPQFSGWRLYGLAGVGLTRFGLDVKQQVEVPFPGGAPNSVTSPVFTYGGGVERKVLPLVRLKLEVRDYVTGLSERFFTSGGTFHRTAVLGGVVFGR